MKTKTKTKTKTKSKSKKGGQLVNYSFESPWHREHTPLWEHSNDCVPNTFYLLGYCNEENARYMALVKGGPYGLLNTEMLDMIHRAYPGKHWFQKVEPPYNFSEIINTPNTGTLLSLDGKDQDGRPSGGHALAVVYCYSEETSDYDHFILCGQTREVMLLKDYLDLHKNSIYECNVLMSENIIDGHYQVNRDIIDEVLAPGGALNWETGPWRIVYWYDEDDNEYRLDGNSWVCEYTGERMYFHDTLTVSELRDNGMTSFTDSDHADWYDFIGWKASGWSGSYGDTIDDEVTITFGPEWYPARWGDRNYTWLLKNGVWKRQGGGRGIKTARLYYNLSRMTYDLDMRWFVDSDGIPWNRASGFITNDKARFGGWIPEGWQPE